MKDQMLPPTILRSKLEEVERERDSQKAQEQLIYSCCKRGMCPYCGQQTVEDHGGDWTFVFYCTSQECAQPYKFLWFNLTKPRFIMEEDI